MMMDGEILKKEKDPYETGVSVVLTKALEDYVEKKFLSIDMESFASLCGLNAISEEERKVFCKKAAEKYVKGKIENDDIFNIHELMEFFKCGLKEITENESLALSGEERE